MLKHKTTMDEAKRLNLKTGTVVGLVPYSHQKGEARKYKVYYEGKLIKEDFVLTEKDY